MHTTENDLTKERTKRYFKILDSANERTNLEKVVFSATQLNTDGRKLLLILLNELE